MPCDKRLVRRAGPQSCIKGTYGQFLCQRSAGRPGLLCELDGLARRRYAEYVYVGGTDGVTLSNQGIVGGLTRTWVAGGTVGTLVALTNHVVTVAGREDEQTLWLVIRDK